MHVEVGWSHAKGTLWIVVCGAPKGVRLYSGELRPILCVVQLKLREALLPDVVSQVEALESHASSNGSTPQASANGKKGKGKGARKGAAPLKTWTADPKLFPCDVSPEAQKLIDEVSLGPPYDAVTASSSYGLPSVMVLMQFPSTKHSMP